MDGQTEKKQASEVRFKQIATVSFEGGSILYAVSEDGHIYTTKGNSEWRKIRGPIEEV